MRAVHRGALCVNPMKGGLNYGVGLGVDTPAKLMAFTRWNLKQLPKAPDILAVGKSCGSPVVACAEDMLVPDEDGSHVFTEACGAF